MRVFVPHHTLLAADGASPRCWMLMLHGIYGSGGNWRTFARKLVERRPDWGAVLVDLRMHGQSQDAPAPHTVAAAAGDLAVLAKKLAADGKPVRAVLGHSFGGKVAMVHRAGAGPELMHTWVIDASPSAQPGAMDDPDNTVARVLRTLQSLPPSFPSRDDFMARIDAAGFAPMLGQWLALSLDRRGDAYVLRLDPAVMEELLTDYYRLDSWPAVERGPGSIHVVIAGQSSALSRADRKRLAGLAREPGVEVATIDESGHWVHVDAPDALLELVARGLGQC